MKNVVNYIQKPYQAVVKIWLTDLLTNSVYRQQENNWITRSVCMFYANFVPDKTN